METGHTLTATSYPYSASMGPPPFGDGNGQYRRGVSCLSSRFNGATAFRRWKLDESVVRFAALYKLQWGHRLSAMETSYSTMSPGVSPCFNGATAFRRWKHIGRTLCGGSCGCFNGATAFRRWKLCELCRPDEEPLGFNGATAFRRWKLTPEQTDIVEFVQLQWGHRLSAMETPPSEPPYLAALSRFNGATAFRRWKRLGYLGIAHYGFMASMGPPPFGDGNRYLRVSSVVF